MDFKAINFGKADAHTEGESFPELLSKGFLNISSIVDKAVDSSTFLFLGYKGSGKSSLSEHLRLQSNETIVDQQQLKDFPFKSFHRLLPSPDETVRYKQLWRWILSVKAFTDLYNDSSVMMRSQENIKQVVSYLTQASLFPVMSISSLLKKTAKETIGASVSFLKVSHEEETESIEVDIELITDYLMNLLTGFKEERPHILIIDDLDDILRPNSVQFSIISALINEVKEMNRFFTLSSIPFKILVLCRMDMFDRLPDPNKNKIKQDNSFLLTWYREGVDSSRHSDLINLINLRARLVYPDLLDVIDAFFPFQIDGRGAHQALLNYTRRTPRDFIQLMNHIQAQCSDNTETVPEEAVNKGVKEYSNEYFKQEIADEMTGYFDRNVIEQTFHVLSSLEKSVFSYEELLIMWKSNFVLKKIDMNAVLSVLYDCSAIGHRVHLYSGHKNKGSMSIFKCRQRASLFTPHKTIVLHRGLWSPLNAAPYWNIKVCPL